MNPAESQRDTWEELRAIAKHTVDALIARLPDDLRQEALRIGYELRKRCWDSDDTLGQHDSEDCEMSNAPTIGCQAWRAAAGPVAGASRALQQSSANLTSSAL